MRPLLSETHSDMFYAEVLLEDGATIPLAADYDERGIYVVEGAIEIAGEVYGAGRLVVLRPGDEIKLTSKGPSRSMFLGGEPMDGPRYLWWNFVASSKDRIEQAKNDWKLDRFERVPGDDEKIPLPERLEDSRVSRLEQLRYRSIPRERRRSCRTLPRSR